MSAFNGPAENKKHTRVVFHRRLHQS